MSKIFKQIIPLLFILLVLSSCALSQSSNMDIFQYKNSYLGNNSAVGNIIKQLPNNKEFKKMTLQTKQKPFGMTVSYENISVNPKNIVINNATFLFALIKNVEWITFEFADKKYTLTRQQLNEWYGKDVRSYTNENDLEELIHTNLKDKDKVNQLFIK
ncbi:DUF4825 domain-containing protein [Bacillus sp. AFS002410]|uniref:DUF4825 domain-containing protein n=1 Tax=Bacillus sp. AFS002410 TaxID=2033481 RepID=UPI000BF0614D|nr:DUF4825 domain-containing protein [Bacillus sp. AFS002410]PEJ46695.1 DUF4825 domain-containing protein [Bacillus sp. AFS002410]